MTGRWWRCRYAGSMPSRRARHPADETAYVQPPQPSHHEAMPGWSAMTKNAWGSPPAGRQGRRMKGNGAVRTWQERAIERRLGDARARAVARSTHFMTTALELVQESGHANFTLQTLADRANLSLRTFYQHFAGKDELLLALYEDVTAQFTEAIREKVEAAEGPMAQLEAWCKGVLSRPGSSQEVGGRLVLIFNLSLEMDHPEAFAKVWEPHRKLLTEILTACSEAGLIRKDLSLQQLTSLLGYTMTSFGQFNALHEGMEGTSLTEGVVWSWCRQAILPSTEEPGA